jgi:hypothetical protein
MISKRARFYGVSAGAKLGFMQRVAGQCHLIFFLKESSNI